MQRRLLNIYILTEILPGFLVNILVFTSIFLMARIMDLISLVVGRGVSLATISQIISLLGPKILSMTIPIATLLAVLTAFLRLSADSELTVLRASGLSIYQLLPPVIFFGLVTTFFAALFTIWLAPNANWDFKLRLLSLAKMRADLALQEQVFVRDFPGLVLYVGKIDHDSDVLGQLFIQDQRDPETHSVIVAQRGRLGVDSDNGVLLFHLEDGTIDTVYKSRPQANSVKFGTYELKFSPGSEFTDDEGGLVKGRAELPTSELLLEAEQTNDLAKALSYRLEWHRRLSYPAATMIMSIIGLALGASFRVRGRNFALVMGLAVFVSYYALFSFGWFLGEKAYLSAGLAVWLPNIVTLFIGLILLKRTSCVGVAIDPLERLKLKFGLAKKGRSSCPVK